MAKKRPKLRAEFRKNHQGRVRQGDFTRDFHRGDKSETLADMARDERVSGKGELTRKRTIIGSDARPEDESGLDVRFGDHDERLQFGCVLSVHGLRSRVLGDDGREYMCIVRQLLKSLSTDQRNVVATGDRVGFSAKSLDSGMIERIEPRHGVLSRTSKGRQHVIVTNVDFLLIVASCAQPGIKPALIDRYLLTAEQYGIRPIICLNKIDLIDPVSIQQIAGVYAQLGYRVLMTSAEQGINLDYLRALLAGKQTAIAGQSGVGKSSLLNAIEPTLALRVGLVSRENEKGKHTTTAARLIPLAAGGAVIDTPGIRQFQLWDITAGEVAALMPDLRPYVSKCRYPDCLHVHEEECAVKEAVADARIDARRYDAYCHLIEDELHV
ncbi:MAG: ribosome small subunit-dependent GTPase A [Planctomycetaceae bacterium]